MSSSPFPSFPSCLLPPSSSSSSPSSSSSSSSDPSFSPARLPIVCQVQTTRTRQAATSTFLLSPPVKQAPAQRPTCLPDTPTWTPTSPTESLPTATTTGSNSKKRKVAGQSTSYVTLSRCSTSLQLNIRIFSSLGHRFTGWTRCSHRHRCRSRCNSLQEPPQLLGRCQFVRRHQQVGIRQLLQLEQLERQFQLRRPKQLRQERCPQALVLRLGLHPRGLAIARVWKLAR